MICGTVEIQLETYVIVYEVCSQMLFDFLNKAAHGTQLDCTSLELPKVRSESARA